jgi:hypothetical protein
MLWPWMLLVIAAQWGLATGVENSSYPEPALAKCPMARFDMEANRYVVFPVSRRIRSTLEVRKKIPGAQKTCTGPILRGEKNGDDIFSFEAAHFVPDKNAWEGVLEQKVEKYIHGAIKRGFIRGDDSVVEDKFKEDAEKVERDVKKQLQIPVAEEDLFEVCIVDEGICVGTLEKPPLPAFGHRAGIFALRSRASDINFNVTWMIAVAVIFIVLAILECWFVKVLLGRLYTNEDEVSDTVTGDEDTVKRTMSAMNFVELAVGTTRDIIMKVIISLGRMAAAASTLILVCASFLFKREVDRWLSLVIISYPIFLMLMHSAVVVGAGGKTLLYNSLLRDRLHIVFTEQGLIHLHKSPMWLSTMLMTFIFLWVGFRTLLEDARTGACVAEAGDTECSPAQIGVYVGLGFWGLLFPVGYCVYLIYQDVFFEANFLPLYEFYNNKPDDLELAEDEAKEYFSKLEVTSYADFIQACHEIKIKDGMFAVNADNVKKKLQVMKTAERPHEKRSSLMTHSDSWQLYEDKESTVKELPKWFISECSLWSWRLRMRHSKNKALELRLLLVVVTAAYAWIAIAAMGANVYRQYCIPTLEELTPSIGQLSPRFDPYVFNYNIFVDPHIKSAGLEVITEKEFTASTSFYMPGVDEDDAHVEAWIKKANNVHVPYLVRSTLADKNISQADKLRASRRAPVPIELLVEGGGTVLKYRITIVKLETRIASLTYKYNTSSSVDEVTVNKKVNLATVPGAEESDSENAAFGDTENEGAAVYVPEDTEEVSIKMHKELEIFGPAGGTLLKGDEQADFQAGRDIKLCPPDGSGASWCNHHKTSGSRISLDNDVTALPVELVPSGNGSSSAPARFMVNIIRVTNRLINLDMEGAMGREATSGGNWASMASMPAFRPLIDHYETFFEVPEHVAAGGKKGRLAYSLPPRDAAGRCSNQLVRGRAPA